ncbi:adenosine deaminase [Elusimicrobiota bacterium]
MSKKNIEAFIKNIPKAELHIHIEGSLEPELMFKLAQRNKIELGFKNVKEVKKAYNFRDLQSFLNIYYEGAKVLVREQDFFDLTWAYFKRIAEQKVLHAEIFFDPQAHAGRQVPFKTVIKGIHKACEQARTKLGISSKLIMCILRHLSSESAMKTLKQALPHKEWIAGIGLDSSEMNNPPSKFTTVFDKARKEGLLLVAHAGEEGPSDYIKEALDQLKVNRIDHGVQCAKDPDLVRHLAQLKMPLTVCPLSNIKLRVFKDMKKHNLKKLLDQGLCITVNSDDPAYFGGYVTENLLATQKALNLDKKDIYQLERNAFESSFLDFPEKQALLKKLARFTEKNGIF